MKILGLILGALLLSSTISGTAFAQSELNGRWIGTLRKVRDTCGFTEKSRKVTHYVTAGAASIFLRDESNILTWAVVPYYGKNRQGYYWRTVPSSELQLGDGRSLLMAYTYKNVNRGRASLVEQYASIQYPNGARCEVIYRGSAARR